MGNCCSCVTGPCDTAEETSGLLGGSIKSAGPAADTVMVGAFQNSPEADAGVRKTTGEEEAVKSPQDVNAELGKTQENGSVRKEPLQTQEASANRATGVHEDSTGEALDGTVEEPGTDSGAPVRPHCTLEAQKMEWAPTNQKVPPEAGGVPSEDLPAASLGAETSCPQSPPAAAAILPDRVTPETARDDEIQENCFSMAANNDGARHSEDPPHCDAPSSPPVSLLPTEAGQVPSVPMPGQGISVESALLPGPPPRSPSRPYGSPPHAVTEEGFLEKGSSPAHQRASAEAVLSQDVPETPLQSGSPPLNQNRAERSDPAGSVGEPVTSGAPSASGSSSCIQVTKLDFPETAVGRAGLASSEKPVEHTEREAVLETEGDASEGMETESGSSETVTKAEEDDEPPGEMSGREKLPTGAEVPLMEQGEFPEDEENSDEDLYRGAEELTPTLSKRARLAPPVDTTCPEVEERCSVAPAVDLLRYSEREWRGSTAKSALIRKGYRMMSSAFGCLRRVRGDNYCALRATLFQVLCHSDQLPAWLQRGDFASLPRELEARGGLLSHWVFPAPCQQGDGDEDAGQRLTRYAELLQNTWRAAVACPGAEERQRLCEEVFQGGEDELGLLEALKLLMLGRAAELHGRMQAGEDVPFFCWLLFARDSSQCPETFLSNHLSQVGFSGGLEQVEMFLLGHALQCTIQVYRLYKADTEEFVTCYPDDHKDDWPSVSLVTEDDRHYNIPARPAANG